MEVQIRAPLAATEIEEHVVDAATAWWPDAAVALGDGVVATADSMARFRDRVWELRIIDTVRSALLAGCERETMRFRLDKQAALAGKVSIPPARHPLGDLDVRVRLDPEDEWADAEALAWWICPETKDGQIVDPSDQADGSG